MWENHGGAVGKKLAEVCEDRARINKCWETNNLEGIARDMKPFCHVCVIVWNCNDLFNKDCGLLKTCPEDFVPTARRLAEAAKQFPFCVAIVGGSSEQWRCDTRFDVWVDQARRTFTDNGVFWINGHELWRGMQYRDGDAWHVNNCPENKKRMAECIRRLVEAVIHLQGTPKWSNSYVDITGEWTSEEREEHARIMNAEAKARPKAEKPPEPGHIPEEELRDDDDDDEDMSAESEAREGKQDQADKPAAPGRV